MSTFCIFCGNGIKDKSREHILPRWLGPVIGTESFFGFNMLTGTFPDKPFPIESFTFPSCSSCNHSMSTLESRAKGAIELMLADKPMSNAHIEALMDWLDKVRHSFCFAQYYWYYHKYLKGVPPRTMFKDFINDCVGARDRMLAIYRHTAGARILGVVGVDCENYGILSRCIGLILPRHALFSLSDSFLFARRIGWPYSLKKGMVTAIRDAYHLSEGLQRRIHPLVRKPRRLKGLEFYQPVIMRQQENAELEAMYSNDYVAPMRQSPEGKRGHVYVERGKELERYPETPSLLWQCDYEYEASELTFDLFRQVYEFQLDGIVDGECTLEFIEDPSFVRFWKSQVRNAKTRFKRYMTQLDEQQAVHRHRENRFRSSTTPWALLSQTATQFRE